MLMKAQGYTPKENIMFQDNKSTTSMEGNVRTSCDGNSRYINIIYLFVKYRVDKKEM